MEVRTILVKESTVFFENKVKEYLEKGFEIKASNITIEKENNILDGSSLSNKSTFYYYALLTKE